MPDHSVLRPRRVLPFALRSTSENRGIAVAKDTLASGGVFPALAAGNERANSSCHQRHGGGLGDIGDGTKAQAARPARIPVALKDDGEVLS